jgi:AAHS family 4-hydroxybenzoate transporter-like MFS transporter
LAVTVGRQVHIRDLTDDARITSLHILTLTICFLTAVVDGLDNQAIGFSAPAIAIDLGFALARFGVVFSAGTIGTLVGAVVLGRLADRIGRRPALMLCTVLFAAFTGALIFARTVTELSLLRFVGGLGLGGAMPCFLTLVSEYAPKARKALATGLIWCGYPAGGVIGGLIGSQLLPSHGWRAIFYLGSGLAFLVALLQWLWLPESLQFMALHDAKPKRINRVAAQLAPGFNLEGVRFVADAPTAKLARVRDVFSEGRAIPTILLWIPLFVTFMMTTFMVLWMPGLLKTAGMPIATAALMLALGNFSSLPSQAMAGYFLDKIGPYRVLPLTYTALAIAVAILAFSLKVVPLVAASMVLIGFLQGPGITGMLYLTTSIYPSRVRSTGVGLAMGVGRSGQVVGSLVIGWIVAQGVAVKWTVLSMSVAPLIALVCVAFMIWRSRKERAWAPAQSPM